MTLHIIMHIHFTKLTLCTWNPNLRPVCVCVCMCLCVCVNACVCVCVCGGGGGGGGVEDEIRICISS